MAYRVAIIAVLCALASPSFAAPANDCRPMAQIMQMVVSNPAYRSHGILSGEALAKAVGIYNSIPPESDDQWDLVVLVNRVDGSGDMLMGRGSELCAGLRLPQPRWTNLINILFDTAI